MNTLASFKLDYHHRLVKERNKELWLQYEEVKDAISKFEIILWNEDVQPNFIEKHGISEFRIPLKCYLATDINYYVNKFQARIEFESGAAISWQTPVQIQQIICQLNQRHEDFKVTSQANGIFKGGWSVECNKYQTDLPEQHIHMMVQIPQDVQEKVNCKFRVDVTVKLKEGSEGLAPLTGGEEKRIPFNNLANL